MRIAEIHQLKLKPASARRIVLMSRARVCGGRAAGMSKFMPFGPFEMPRIGSLIDTRELTRLWAKIEQQHPGLAHAVGCYIFAIRAGKGAMPWYVGKTEKRNLRDETSSPHKLLVYTRALNVRERGTPLLYLIAKQTRIGRYAKPRRGGIGDIRALENLLIGTCLLRNGKLLNVKQVKHPKGIVVPGYMNEPRGARSGSATGLAKILGT